MIIHMHSFGVKHRSIYIDPVSNRCLSIVATLRKHPTAEMTYQTVRVRTQRVAARWMVFGRLHGLRDESVNDGGEIEA
jgi:hypothetical protein